MNCLNPLTYLFFHIVTYFKMKQLNVMTKLSAMYKIITSNVLDQLNITRKMNTSIWQGQQELRPYDNKPN